MYKLISVRKMTFLLENGGVQVHRVYTLEIIRYAGLCTYMAIVVEHSILRHWQSFAILFAWSCKGWEWRCGL